MNTKSPTYQIVIAGVITCVAIVVFATTLANALFISPGSDSAAADSSSNIAGVTALLNNDYEEKTAEYDEAPPVRLIIPSILVDASVQKVGVNSLGNMANPSNFTDVGWYKDGVTPGEPGSAVMAGHVDNGLSLPGVFKRLDRLALGSELFVATENGDKIRFVVKEISVFEYDKAPSEAIFSSEGEPVLRLITCSGRWLSGEQTYDKRIVVTAERADLI